MKVPFKVQLRALLRDPNPNWLFIAQAEAMLLYFGGSESLGTWFMLTSLFTFAALRVLFDVRNTLAAWRWQQ